MTAPSPTEMRLRRGPSHTARGGSCYADFAAAERALAMVRPMIDAGLRDREVCGSGCLGVVLMDPAITPHGGASFEDAILLEAAFEQPRWDADYAAFARAKAACAWHHQSDAHLVQTVHPHLLRAGDSLLRGGVCRDGIVVGVSGALACYDEVFAIALAAALRAQACLQADEARAKGALLAVVDESPGSAAFIPR